MTSSSFLRWTQLIHHLQSTTWHPGRYHDTYREAEKIVTSKPARTDGKVLDLLTALKHSLASGAHGTTSAEGKKHKAQTKRSKRARNAA